MTYIILSFVYGYPLKLLPSHKLNYHYLWGYSERTLMKWFTSSLNYHSEVSMNRVIRNTWRCSINMFQLQHSRCTFIFTSNNVNCISFIAVMECALSVLTRLYLILTDNTLLLKASQVLNVSLWTYEKFIFRLLAYY